MRDDFVTDALNPRPLGIVQELRQIEENVAAWHLKFSNRLAATLCGAPNDPNFNHGLHESHG